MRARLAEPTMVMSTGIVSVDLSHLGRHWASVALLVIACAGWLDALTSGELWRQIAGVPATCVIGTRLAVSTPAVGWALGAAGLLLWCRHLPRTRVPPHVTGSDLLPVVATQSLVVLGATFGAGWLHVPCLVLLVAGMCLYARSIVRFDRRQLTTADGDQWVAGGALAISALACATLASAWGAPSSLRVASLVLWGASVAWLPALLAGEAVHPRIGSLPARWSTVFPIGMYVAMTIAVEKLA